ncbi:MAG: thioesterase family protein [Bryobacteraceae bacterium]
MSEIPIGHKGERKERVSAGIAVDFMGQPGARVLGTPYLIGLLEMTARDSIKPLLDDGYDTVGTEVNVRHLAATPMGMSVVFQSEVVSVEGRRVRFKVEAWDEKEKISDGIHERFIVHVGRFAERLDAKRKAHLSRAAASR